MLKSVIKSIILFIFKAFYPYQIVRTSLSDKIKQAVIMPNHQSFLDGIFVMLAMKELNPVFIVHAQVIKNPLFRFIVSLTDYIIVDTQNPMSMKSIIKMAHSGRSIVIFPEGRLTTTGGLMKIYDGIAFLIAKTDLPIIPIVISGAQKSVLSKTKSRMKKKWLAPVTVSILPTESLPDVNPAHNAKQHRQQAARLITAMMKEAQVNSNQKHHLLDALLDQFESVDQNLPFIEDIKSEQSYQQWMRQTIALHMFFECRIKNSSKLSNYCALNNQPEKVGIFLPNNSATLSTFFAVNAAGFVPAMLDYTMSEEVIIACIQSVEIKTIITSAMFIEADKLEKYVAIFESLGISILYLEETKKYFSLNKKIILMVNEIAPRLYFEQRKYHADSDEAVVLFTSDLDGTPKGVSLSHQNILTNIVQLKAMIDIRDTDHFFNALPLFNSFGLTCGALLPLLSGSKIFLYPTPLHYKIIPEIVYDRDCTVLLGTNTFLMRYAKQAHPQDFGTLRHVIAVTEKLQDSTKTFFANKFGLRVLEGYGATEASPMLSLNTPSQYKENTVGQLLPGIQYNLVPIEGVEEGCQLLVRGRNIMRGYYKATRPNKLHDLIFQDNWYNTGDIVSVDGDGFIRIIGRTKFFAKNFRRSGFIGHFG
jgi:acyl-[acyl-carrier-protein]-phospholipid O-acyltransferase/long-chain-fatty-acid--[acyl-carrier-protein] ligase